MTERQVRSTKEALKLALEALEDAGKDDFWRYQDKAITAIKEALAQLKYRRGDRLICLETDEYCVIHISGTDRQWVKFPDTHIGVYTNEQVTELFELLPKEPEQEPVEVFLTDEHQMGFKVGVQSFILDYWPDLQSEVEFMKTQLLTAFARAAPPQRKPLTENEIKHLWYEACQTNLELTSQLIVHLARNIEAAHGIYAPTERKGEA